MDVLIEWRRKNLINKMFFLVLIIFFINNSLCEECPRNKPILKDNKCSSLYCTSEEFEKGICIISNSFIKSQWLNNIHSFLPTGISHVWATSDSKGDVFLISQGFTAGNAGDKYIYAFQKDGNGYFNYLDYTFEDNVIYYSFEDILLPDNEYSEIFYNIEIEDKQYLLSTQTGNEMVLIDWYKDDYLIFKLNSSSYFSNSLFPLKGFNDDNNEIYFNDFVYCKEYLTYNDCFLGLRIFNLTLLKLTTLLEKIEEPKINTKAKINCFQNEDLYIQCIYTIKETDENGQETYKRVLSLFNNRNLNMEYNEVLQENCNFDNTFDSTIQLSGNIFVTGFSLPHDRNIIKLLLKKVVVNSNSDEKKFKLENYIPDIDYININEDQQYSISKGLEKRNTLVKISENKFAILLNEFSDEEINEQNDSFNKYLLILIVNIFDNSKISIRHYKINFDLYNLIILEDLRGYTLNNFFGVLIEAGIKASSYTTKAIFLTFGYVNSTIDSTFVDTNLKLNNNNSIIKLGDYISDIENNLFAYTVIGVRILHLPVKKSSGYFINVETNEEIKEGNVLSLNTTLRFILVRELITEKNIFSIDFAPVVKEPDFDLMNQNAERVDIYPINDTELEREFYSPRAFEARVIKYKFYLGCYESCNGCYKITNNPDDQQCIKCKDNYYFIEGTDNCFLSKKGYYFNEETKTLRPCNFPCEECDPPEESSKFMNCISCKEGYTLFDSTNCLKCDKYVNYEMTECIDEIPEGYYLKNKTAGTLGQCHNLCKTCKGDPIAWSMNCIECKYNNAYYEPSYPGNCPSEDGIFDEEEEIEMPGGECPRSKPILVRNDFCFMGYCSPEDIENEICEIKNSIIEEQWMNKMQRFGEGNIFFINVEYGTNGELFLIGQKRENQTYENIIYGFDKYGGPLFFNKTKNEYYSSKIIDFPSELFLEKIKFITNYDTKKSFFLSTQLEKNMYELNIEEDKTIIHSFNYTSFSSDNIIALRNHPGEYITYFTFCQNEVDFDLCFPFFRKFKFESENNEIKIIKEMISEVNIDSETKLICIEDYGQYIMCIYSEINEQKLNHQLGLFKIDNLDKAFVSDIEVFFDKNPFFDDMINLNDEAFVVAFSKEQNIIQVLIKTYIYVSPHLGNYIENVDFININVDFKFNEIYGQCNRNTLSKINDNKFAMLINSFKDVPEDTFHNPSIDIYIFSIFNNHKNVNIRKYSINFKLYNTFNYGSILGYNIGQFFGILIELASPDNNFVLSSSFMTFGYVNSTGPTVIYDKEFVLENSLESHSITLGNFIGNIENNLFGYGSLNVIILSLPDESLGYFVKYNNEKIKVNDLISKSTEIKLKLAENYKAGNYSLFFAGAVKEPDYDKMNKFVDGKILSFPNNSNADEKDFYTPQILIGKRVEFNFEIKGKGENQDEEECYPSCLECYSKSKDEDNHLCKICKQGFYFKEDTYNCYKEIKEYYYFNEEAQVFSPCFIDCLTCNNKEINSTYMNCLSCESTYKFYEKSKNCLNCPKYVNYLQSECIDKIPDGYYLSNPELGTIEKCHDLCKTCSGPFYDKDTKLFMNCITCKYRNKNQSDIPDLEGNCPSSEQEEKENDEPIDGQCPREKPILKNNKCYKIYCTEEEFNQGICQIYNNYIKKQWLNNFHSFDNTSTYIDYDINEKGDLFLLAQKKDEPNYNQYIYGFSKNGTGLFYDKEKNKYSSFRKITYRFQNFIENIKYIEINNEGYLINILRDKQIYLYDFNNNEIYTHSFFYIPFSVDTIIKLKNKDNTYLFDFIYCVDEIFSNCYIGFSTYKIEKKNSFVLEKTNSEELLKVGYNTKLTCFENSDNIIQCKYSIEKNTTYLQVVTLFNRDTFEIIEDFILDEFYLDFPTFDSMIELKDNGCVIAYSTNPNIIHILFKKITLKDYGKYEMTDYLYNIPYININEDSIYDFSNGNSYKNHLFKLDDDKFIMLINNCKDNIESTYLNNALVIIVFHIYNFNRNVILRHYKIDFGLYNMFIDGDLMGYKLGGFFGAIIELTSPTEKYAQWAAFLTFGYVNTTEDISSEEGTNDLINNKKSIKLSDYITGIENNLFGYEFVGVKVLSLPDENKAGYFININNNNNKINLNELYDLNSELRFEIKENPIFGDYYISFAGVVKEPEFQESNDLANKVEYYPSSAIPEKYYDEQEVLIGREFKYNFSIKEKKEESKCYKNCETCIRPSENINEQDCLKCKENFYFKEGTRNCYDKIEYQYYFNPETKTFSPCYKDCYTCSTKENKSDHMNCLSCFKLYKFYEKSTNCLKCPKYVNYLQTKCIDEIPNGYFLLDSDRGIIGKCHDLCKTCKAEPQKINNVIHMNCEQCKYSSENNYLIEGNCPEKSKKKKKKDKEDNSSGSSSALIWVAIVLVILIVIISGLIIYIKYFKNKRTKKNTDYYNIGKDIPFEDENSFGINS